MPEEIAIREAIKAEYEALSAKGVTVDLAHPYAAGETLCSGVNVRLKAAARIGEWAFKDMKGKAIGNRLRLGGKDFSVLEERNSMLKERD